jgi:hypothetical protein
LRLTLQGEERARDWLFVGPDGTKTVGRSAGENSHAAELPTTWLAGVYEAEFTPDPRRREYFVAAADRAESDLTPLDPPHVQRMQQNSGIRFVRNLDDYESSTRSEPEAVELWRWLLLAVVAGLVLETVITRRLVRRGHMDVEAGLAEEALLESRL